MAIVAGRVLENKQQAWNALRKIKGVGRTTAYTLCEKAGILPETYVHQLDEKQLEGIRTALNEYVIEGDLRRETQERIKELERMGCIRGIRHRRGLPVNGQRTKTNAKTRKRRNKRKD